MSGYQDNVIVEADDVGNSQTAYGEVPLVIDTLPSVATPAASSITAGSTLSGSSVLGSSSGVIAELATAPEHGQLTLKSDGTFTYIADTGYVGQDSFSFVASDGKTTGQPITETTDDTLPGMFVPDGVTASVSPANDNCSYAWTGCQGAIGNGMDCGQGCDAGQCNMCSYTTLALTDSGKLEPQQQLPQFQSKSFFVKNANKIIDVYKKGLPANPTNLDIAIARNKFITAAYAKMYMSDPDAFPWLGLAAIASNDIGLALKTLNDGYKLTQNGGNFELAGTMLVRQGENTVLQTLGKILGDGNLAVFNDIYWQFIAYQFPGIKQLEFINGQSKNDLSNSALAAWQSIATGSATGNLNLVWSGNTSLFLHEQKDTLQPFFNKLPPYAGKLIAGETTSLFPNATPFKKVGNDISVFEQRWDRWIEPVLWPEWKKYWLQNGDSIFTKMQLLAEPLEK